MSTHSCAVRVTIVIFSTGGKFRLVSNFMELHTLTLAIVLMCFWLTRQINAMCITCYLGNMLLISLMYSSVAKVTGYVIVLWAVGGQGSFAWHPCVSPPSIEGYNYYLIYELAYVGLSFVPTPPPFLPSVCVHNNTQERNYSERKRKVEAGEAWERGYVGLLFEQFYITGYIIATRISLGEGGGGGGSSMLVSGDTNV